MDNDRTILNREFPRGDWTSIPSKSRTSSCMDMAGQEISGTICEFANKTTVYKVSTPCIDHHFKEEETKSVGELSNTCSQIVLNGCNMARIGRLDILWSK